jgi:hypothetical protein
MTCGNSPGFGDLTGARPDRCGELAIVGDATLLSGADDW